MRESSVEEGGMGAAGLDGDWLDFILGGVWCMLREVRGGWWGMSVRRKSNRLWDCAWDGKIDETENGGFKI